MFFLSKDGATALNSSFVKGLFIDWSYGVVATVYAKTSNSSYKEGSTDDVWLATFNTGDGEKNFRAAKKYLANLVKILNGGGE